MSVQTRSTRVKAPAISDPDNVPAEARSTNEKGTLNLSGRVGFDRPLEGSSVNHENDYYKILKSQILKSHNQLSQFLLQLLKVLFLLMNFVIKMLLKYLITYFKIILFVLLFHF